MGQEYFNTRSEAGSGIQNGRVAMVPVVSPLPMLQGQRAPPVLSFLLPQHRLSGPDPKLSTTTPHTMHIHCISSSFFWLFSSLLSFTFLDSNQTSPSALSAFFSVLSNSFPTHLQSGSYLLLFTKTTIGLVKFMD